MNGLSSISSWGGEQKPLLAYVYGAIDSKIDFVELNTRKLLAKLSRKETTQVQGMHRTDAVQNLPTSADMSANFNENDNFFTHLEELSRKITMLENMKFSLREHNATSIMQLLDDDKFMKFDDLALNEALDLHEGKM
jgi:Tfp pilus assembly protein PilO